jgi:hypothetical protein
MAAKTRAWKAANPERADQLLKTWRKNNQDKIRDQVSAWREANPGKTASYNAIRRSIQSQRTPKWLTKEQRAQIEKYYAEAIRLTQTLGELYTVDHIVPLRGRTVSGLHVPWNLQVMKGSENFQKNNKFTIDPE